MESSHPVWINTHIFDVAVYFICMHMYIAYWVEPERAPSRALQWLLCPFDNDDNIISYVLAPCIAVLHMRRDVTIAGPCATHKRTASPLVQKSQIYSVIVSQPEEDKERGQTESLKENVGGIVALMNWLNKGRCI